jgi:hypothetical protein
MGRGERRGGGDWLAGKCRRAGRKSPEVLGAYQATRVDTSLEAVVVVEVEVEGEGTRTRVA